MIAPVARSTSSSEAARFEAQKGRKAALHAALTTFNR